MEYSVSLNTTAGRSDIFGPLIEETCEMVGVPPASVWQGAAPQGCRIATFRVMDTECVLSHRLIMADRLFIHCGFGPMPVARTTDALVALLQLNLVMYGGNSPAFAMDTERNVLLCMELSLEAMGVNTLVQTLENLAMQASGWRKAWLAHE